MSDPRTQKKDITTMPEITLPESKGELINSPPPEPSLADLTATIRSGHTEVERAALKVVWHALQTGKALIEAKKQVGHGNFEDYVAIECRMVMRTAQNYMKLARNEAEIIQSLEEKRNGHAYLTMGEALKIIGKLSANSKRRKRAKPKPA